MIQVFGTKKCRDTQKTLRFFKERDVEVQFRDILEKPPSPGELDDMAGAAGGAEALVDSTGAAAKERGLAYLVYDARDELQADPRLYRTPLVRPEKGTVLVGYDEKALKKLAVSR